MLLLFLIFLLSLLSHPSGTASPVIMTNVCAGAGSGCERTDPGGVPVDGGTTLVGGRAEGYDGETLVKGHTGHHSR